MYYTFGETQWNFTKEQQYTALKNAGVKRGLTKTATTSGGSSVDGYFFGAGTSYTYTISNEAWSDFKSIVGLPDNVDNDTLGIYVDGWLNLNDPNKPRYTPSRLAEMNRATLPSIATPLSPQVKKWTDYINTKNLYYVGGGLALLGVGLYVFKKIIKGEKPTF